MLIIVAMLTIPDFTLKGPKMWNDIPADIKLSKSMVTFKKMYKALLLQPYQFVLLVCNDYLKYAM